MPGPRILATIIGVLLIGSLVGCDDTELLNVVALAVPAVEQPPCNVPPSLHQRNELGPLGQGSCVHASMKILMSWLNEPEMADWWWRTYHDGEYDTRLMARLEQRGLPYSATRKADPRFLDWCSDTKRGCVLWWKPSHCCYFAGWVKVDGREYAAIIDNNFPGRFELTPRDQFIRLWAGYGGFALTLLLDPPGSLPYRSYEIL